MKDCLRILLAFCCGLACLCCHAKWGDKELNRPYADLRPWHLGFSVGVHTQGLNMLQSGAVSADGQTWVIEQPSYSPGFCVNGLVSLRLNTYFSARFTPGLYFGNRNLEMREVATGASERQNLKSTYIVAPIDLQYHARRLGNFRPYIVGGVMPAFDVSKHRGELIQLKKTDFFLSIGFGADFYMRYFKFIPEVKFCFGMMDVLQRKRPDLDEDPYKQQFTSALKRAKSKVIVLTFYFE